MRVVHHGETIDGRRFTVVGLYKQEEGNAIKFGVAICGPHDQFARKVGRTIAEGRAIKNPTIKRELKQVIPESKEGYLTLSKLGIEVLTTIREDPFLYQEILTEQYKEHKKTNKQ